MLIFPFFTLLVFVFVIFSSLVSALSDYNTISEYLNRRTFDRLEPDDWQLIPHMSDIDPVFLDEALEWASRNGHESVVSVLLSDPRVDPSDLSNIALRRACENGHQEVVKLLLQDKRVDPSDDDDNAIKCASENGHAEVVELLLKHEKVNPATANNDPLRLAINGNHFKVVETLLKHSTLVNPAIDDDLPIRWAASNGHTRVVELLLVNDVVNPAVYNDYSIKQASLNGHARVVEMLLFTSSVNPSAEDNYALQMASKFGRLEVVEVLLNDPRVDPTAGGNCAIKAAIKNGHDLVVDALFKDARLNPLVRDDPEIIRHLPIALNKAVGSLFLPKKETLVVVSSIDRSQCFLDQIELISFELLASTGFPMNPVVNSLSYVQNACLVELRLTWPAMPNLTSLFDETFVLIGSLKDVNGRSRNFVPLDLAFDFGFADLRFTLPSSGGEETDFFIGESVKVLLSGHQFDLKSEYCNVIDRDAVEILAKKITIMTFDACVEDIPVFEINADKLLNVISGPLSVQVKVSGRLFKIPLRDTTRIPAIYQAISTLKLQKSSSASAAATFELTDSIRLNLNAQPYLPELSKRRVVIAVVDAKNSSNVVAAMPLKMAVLNASEAFLTIPPLFPYLDGFDDSLFAKEFFFKLLEINGNIKFEEDNAAPELFTFAPPKVTDLAISLSASSLTASWTSSLCSALLSVKNDTLPPLPTFSAKLSIVAVESQSSIYSVDLPSICVLQHVFQLELFKLESHSSLTVVVKLVAGNGEATSNQLSVKSGDSPGSETPPSIDDPQNSVDDEPSWQLPVLITGCSLAFVAVMGGIAFAVLILRKRKRLAKEKEELESNPLAFCGGRVSFQSNSIFTTIQGPSAIYSY